MTDHLAEGFVFLEVFRSYQGDESSYLLLFLFSKCNEFFSVESNEQKLLGLDLLFATKVLVYIKKWNPENNKLKALPIFISTTKLLIS